MVDQLMSSHPRRRILICSPRNASIDELVRRLLQLRLKENENRFKRTSVSLLRASYLFYFFCLFMLKNYCGVKSSIYQNLRYLLSQLLLSIAVLRIGKGEKTHQAVLEKTLEYQFTQRSKIKEEDSKSDIQIRIEKLNEENNLLERKKQLIQRKMDTPNSVIGCY